MVARNTPVRDVQPLLAEQPAEPLVERVRPLGRRRLDEARAVPLARVAEERELRDDEDAPAHLGEGEVHLAGGVLEDPQRGDLVGEELRVLVPVLPRDAEEHGEAPADRSGRPPVHPHLGPGDPLHDRAHGPLMARGGRFFNGGVLLRVRSAIPSGTARAGRAGGAAPR